jgi:hypothetical protein
MAHASDEKLLEDIRETWKLDDDDWSDIRDEGAKDIQCLTGGLWAAMDPGGLRQRTDAVRPIITLDELSQYCNQVINDLRQNKRGIKVTPVGNGANDQTALFRQGKIRDIEYRSNSHQAYTTMAENAIQRSYGFLRVKPTYVSDTDFDQELLIEPVVNPDTVTPDCYSVRSDGKDLRRIWVRESRPMDEFKREFPKAEVTDFASVLNSYSPSHRALASKWVHGTTVDIAEAWRKTYTKSRTLLALKPANPNDPPRKVWQDEAGAVPADQILKAREVEQYRVMQYLTNGVEILEETEWKGQSIPFVTCYGKVVYVRDGTETKRKILSLIRLARDPQMLMAYLASSEAEIVGMTTKVPYFYYEGQFTQDALNLLAKSLYEPVAGIPVKPTTPATGPNVLPLPIRNPWEPFLQQLEIFKESVRRSIQAAIGASPLPTQAQRRNEKSGVALEHIKESTQTGSFHFSDHHDEGVARTGQILDESLEFYYDTARDTSIRHEDNSLGMVRINDPTAKYTVKNNKLEKSDDETHQHLDVTQGTHDVTISVGPRKDSEREESNDFAQNLIQSKIPELVGPQKGPKMVAQAIRMLDLGPGGDAMAEIIDPKDTGAPTPQQAAQLAQENDQLKQQLQMASEEIKTDKVKIDGQIHIKELDLQFQREKLAVDSEVKISVAELGAKVDRLQLFLNERERVGLHLDNRDALQHEAQQNAIDRQHEAQQAQLAHQQALAEQDAQTGAQAGLADQGHQQALEQGDQAHQGVLEQQQQAAELTPEPTAGA